MPSFATVEEVRELTSLDEVRELSDIKIQNYIDRAGAWIRRETKRTFEGETDIDILLDLQTATYLLVEYLWYQDNPEVKDNVFSPVETERIGSYSYTMRDVKTVDSIKEREYVGQNTGIKELDLILTALRASSTDASFFFSVSKPSRRNPYEF